MGKAAYIEDIKQVRQAMEKGRSLAYVWNCEKDQFTWSDDPASFFGVAASQSLGSSEGLVSLIRPEDKAKFSSSLTMAQENKGEYQRSFQLNLPENRTLSLLDRGAYCEQNGAPCLSGVIQIVSELGRIPLHTSSSRTDSTNMMAIYSRFDTALLREKLLTHYQRNVTDHTQGVLLKLSVDNLPMLMSWYSLDYANRVMAGLEISLRNLLRQDDYLCRIALDQFGIILQDHSQGEVELLVERMVRKVQMFTNPSFDEMLHLRCSIGSVFFPKDTTSVDDALNKSYLALSCVKSKANALYCDYEEAKREHLNAKDEVGKIHSIQMAINENRLKIAYQPIVDTKTGAIYSYESLLRIEDEQGIIRSAGPLIPIAEKLGVIDIIDFFVMEQIVEELTQYKDITLTFNVSNMTTDDPRWLKLFSKRMSDPDVASRVIVEITETAAQHDMRQTAYFVAAIQNLGCKVALDDFGAGYTSLRQLKTLSVDIVKIDGAFVFGLEAHSDNAIFIKTLVEFNRSYGLTTIAECVETGDVAKQLIDLGVDYLQGYYFGKPEVDVEWKMGAGALKNTGK